MQAGEFLRDLYDRLAFAVVNVPPLRERPSDIALLSQHFLELFMHEVPAFQGKRLSSDATRMLMNYAFPGNGRELKHIIERAVYQETTNEITPEDLGLIGGAPAERADATFHQRIVALEKALLLDALTACNGNQARAARLLGLSYHQFRHYRKKHSGRG